MPPQRDAASCLVVPGATANHASAVNEPPPNLCVLQRSYRDVALTPRPVASPPKTLKPISNSGGCFRCLARDHTVKDCRDPVRCLNCSASGHRSYACPMPLWKCFSRRRRAPSVANPAPGRSGSGSAALRARSAALPASPPPAVQANLQLAVTLPPTLAYDPAFLVPSSSSGPPPVDKLMDGHSVLEPPLSQPSLPSTARASRSPPTAPAPPRVRNVPRLPPAPPSDEEDLYTPSGTSPELGLGVEAISSGGGEEVNSDAFDSSSSDSWEERRTISRDAWVSPGRPELTARLLFAFIDPPVPPTEVSAFLRAALATVALSLPVELLPSTMGAMIGRCQSHFERDALRAYSPILHDGVQLTLLRPDETPNQFFRVPPWLAYVIVTHYPNEHWYASKIMESFAGFCGVAEIDPACLTRDNFGPLRLLLEVNKRLDIPFEVRVSAKEGIGRDGAVARVLPIRVWPRRDQLDDDGRLLPFFRNPPQPPSLGPLLGPDGPIHRMQQRLPPPHPANRMFPPRGSPAGHDVQLPNSVTPGASQALILGIALALTRVLAPPSSSPADADSPAPSPPRLLDADAQASDSARTSSVFSFDPDNSARESPPPTPLFCPALPSCRQTQATPAPVQSRQSARIAAISARAGGRFRDMTSTAVKRKALLNSLSGYSSGLKKQVAKRNLLSRNKLPLGVSEICKLMDAAGIACSSENAVDVVTTHSE